MSLKKSKGNMYEWVSHQHSHLGGECLHQCSYCLEGNTLILLANGQQKPLKELSIGDEIVGVYRYGTFFHYTKTKVIAKWKSLKKIVILKLENGTEVKCSADHQWYTTRGWLHTVQEGKKRRNLGLPSRISCVSNYQNVLPTNKIYKSGYLCGAILGDGYLGLQIYTGRGRIEKMYQFRLACKDNEIIATVKKYLYEILEITCQDFKFPMKDRKSQKWIKTNAIRTSKQISYEKIKLLLNQVQYNDKDWLRGFLAGAFDAEGSWGEVIRISNADEKYLNIIETALKSWGFKSVREQYSEHCQCVRLIGGIPEMVRFFLTTNPQIGRKFNIFGIQLKNSVKVKEIIKTIEETVMYDITTESGNFIANGLLSHNCYVKSNIYKRNPNFVERYSGLIRLIEKEFDTNYGKGKTIFIEHMNDLFAENVPDDFIVRILEHCKKWPENTYVFQTKNPARYFKFLHLIPKNSILGTTIETNRDMSNYSKAPSAKDRYEAMKILNFRKFLTMEPVLKFDVDIMAKWISEIKPEFFNIGADSKGHGLIEPTYSEILELTNILKDKYGIEVREKHNMQRLIDKEKK